MGNQNGSAGLVLLVGLVSLLTGYGDTRPQIELPGESMTNAPVTCAPFPDRLSAFVWRNWFCVPKARLADVVGATPDELTAVAVEMGLPRNPDVLPEWKWKGYITVLRRNWHLLDYPQIMHLLGAGREQLRQSLLEDDFLFVKFGRVKPKCGPLKWDGETVGSRKSERARIARILKEEGADDFSEEPRFSFVRELSTPVPGFIRRPTDASSAFDLRMIFSYFADYHDSLWDDNLGSYPEGLLQRLAAEGVNAVWLHIVLRDLDRDPKYPEFGVGSERRLANLRKLIARTAKYGIKVYVYINEPRGMPADFFEAAPDRAALKGASHHERVAMCTSHPESMRWLRDAIERLFRAAPGLGGMFTITMNENLTHCASKWGKETCPRCKSRTQDELVLEVCKAEVEGMCRGSKDAEAVIWDWGWRYGNDPDEHELVRALPKDRVRFMTVSEMGMPLHRGADVKIDEYSISAPGPSERAKAVWQVAKASGLKTAAKVQANVSWEISPFPYVPAMDLVAEHAVNLMNEKVDGVMLSWTLGCAPAPNLSIYRLVKPGDTKDSVLDRLARELYGMGVAPLVRKAWTAFSEGYRAYPFIHQVVYNAPVHWGSANPLYLEPTGYKATMVGIPYDDLAGWRAVYPEDRWIAQMEKVAVGFDEGCTLFAKAVAAARGTGLETMVAKEADMFRAEQLHFRSTVDQARFVSARDRGNKGEMRRLATRELEAAKELLRICRGDCRVGFECSCHYFYIPQDIREKILGCRAILERLDEGR